MGNFVMPSLGADMETGVLATWLVAAGDSVRRGQVIAEVETHKGLMEVEVFEDGVVEQLLVAPDTEVPVGQVLAVIRPIGAPPAPAPQPAPQPESAEPVAAAPPRPGGNGHRRAPAAADRVKVSPVARRLAEELGVALDAVTGTGPHGVISKADVEAAAARAAARTAAPAPAPPTAPQPAPPPARPADDKAQAAAAAQRMRQAIAAAMARSNRDIPHYYLETDIDMSRANAWLEAENQRRPIRERLLPVVLLIKATALALAKVPQLNGYWRDDALHVQEAIHIGFAIALRQGGLVTPALFDCDAKSLDQLMTDLSDLIQRTRAGRLRASEINDATVTLTSLGDLGVRQVYGVIYPPQVALVGFGKVQPRPWAVDGLLGIRPILTATLAGDHRATDGRIGATFLDELDKRLQAPGGL